MTAVLKLGKIFGFLNRQVPECFLNFINAVDYPEAKKSVRFYDRVNNALKNEQGNPKLNADMTCITFDSEEDRMIFILKWS